MHYKQRILDKNDEGYNSYTGLSALLGDERFMKKSEEVVLIALGLLKEESLNRRGEKEREDPVDAHITGSTIAAAAADVDVNVFPPMSTLIVFAINIISHVCITIPPKLGRTRHHQNIFFK